MATNFDFLKKVDKDLFDIIIDAEKLYRDEYYEQCMTQTRRFGENLCKKVLADKRTTETTFDDMLATLKDKISGDIQEKEFVDDLYFLKKNGNASVHSSRVKQDGVTALECLQRAFEAAISYAVYTRGAAAEILRLRYDTELLVTNKKSKKSLPERYAEEKAFRGRNKTRQTNKKTVKKQSYQMAPVRKRKGLPVFLILLVISSCLSLATLLTLLCMANIK